jgi:tetratricopeptide (TPR) repeat protein
MPEVTIERAIQIAVDHQLAGRIAEAETVYRLILAKQPDNPDALHLCGVAVMQLGREAEGLKLVERAVKINPQCPEYWSNLGNGLRKVGRVDEGIEACRKAIALRPELAEAHNNLANALIEKSLADEAIQAASEAIRLNPNLVEAHNNLGNALSIKGQFHESIAAHREALRLRPGYPEAMNNLGTTLGEIGQLDDAVATLRQVIRLHPHYADAYSNLCLVLSAASQSEESLVMGRRAVNLNPSHAGYRWNLSLDLLGRGMLADGWREYEWRWLWKDFRGMHREFRQPMWKGEDLNGRSILLHFEQGLGDTMQFVRYAPMVRQRGGQVLIQCQRELATLLKSNPELGEVFSQDDALPPFDFHCPLLSLPLIFKTDLKSIPAPIPYLKADPKIAEAWRGRLESAREKLKVGLAWAGSASHKKDRHRSMDFRRFLPLAEIAGVAFVNLQKGPASEQPKALSSRLELIDFTQDLEDFAQTAGLIENLDLIIAVDTAVIHLAGAMGKPARVLLPFAADWRWLRTREDSPWYPTLQLFRQAKFGDWDGVIAKVAAALRDLSGTRGGFTRAD